MTPTQFGCPVPYFPPIAMVGFAAKLYEDLGLDFTVACDQLNFLIPRSIYTPDIIPALANGREFELDAWLDPFLLTAAAASATGRLRFSITCDGLRRPPSVLAQQILSLDHLSSGRTFVCMGAGEVKQFTPYGQKRERPFANLEESMRVTKLLMVQNDLVSYDGPILTLKNAIMRLEPYEPARPPKLVVLGGPGKSVEIAIRGIREGFADGWATWFPPCGDADWYAETVASMRSAAEAVDRDPDDLIFWCGAVSVIYTDPADRERYCENLALRIHSIIEVPGSGPTFKRWGLEHPLGDDFYYARDFIPMEWSREDTVKIAEQVPPEVVAKAKFTGTPAEVAEMILPYVEAGATHVLLANVADLIDAGNFAEAADRQMILMDTIAGIKARLSEGLSAESRNRSDL